MTDLSPFILIIIALLIFSIISIAILTTNAKQEQLRMEEEKARKRKEEEKQQRMEYERQKACERKRKEEEEKVRKRKEEEKQKEVEEHIRIVWEQLGAEVFLSSDLYTIIVKEDVNVGLLFQTLRTYIHRNRYKIIVNQLDGKLLLFFTESSSPSYYKSNISRIQFAVEDITEKLFKGSTAIERIIKMEKFLFCYLNNRRLEREKEQWGKILMNGVAESLSLKSNKENVEDFANDILMQSNYGEVFEKNVNCQFLENKVLVVDYNLPNRDIFMSIKEYKYIASSNEIKELYYSENVIAKEYEKVLYSICLRSIYELFNADEKKRIESIVFNGFVTSISLATGKQEHKCILSISLDRNVLGNIDITHVDPKICFKSLKGVSAAKLINITPIVPIITLRRDDKRFVESRDIAVDDATNLASMNWEDFEHLVRELFEAEFSQNGGEVKVTQASRDGGVDAVVFDPDPLRGGRIVIQAKRYTNTVNVSAVRDLYGTVINEGANSGILITTSDYGHDSYEFAKDKPLKLLNGGHLLSLLDKHGRKAYINIQEAKQLNAE